MPIRNALATWSAKTEVTHRVQYAVFASHFRRLVRLDVTPTEAMCSAFETARRACRDYAGRYTDVMTAEFKRLMGTDKAIPFPAAGIAQAGVPPGRRSRFSAIHR